uniref:Elongation of very long chain fatty acids protein 7-like n=1 Tax=Sinocyclocheilus anshuiensis TaxID=1608454 RepID=A0A671N2V1_9TELE
MYWELKRRTAEGIPVYQQSPVFSLESHDSFHCFLCSISWSFFCISFLHRCGHLTFHIVLPFSFLHYPYIEAAIRATYHKNICNCSLHANSSISEGFENNKNDANEPTEVNNQKTNNTEPVTVEHHHHQHVHHHHHQHVHHHHQNKNNSTGDSDVTNVPKEPIQHSHQEHSHHKS